VSSLATNFNRVQHSRQAAFFRIDDVNKAVSDDLLIIFGDVRIKFLDHIVMRPDYDNGRVGSSGLDIHQPLQNFVDASVAVHYSPHDEVQASFRQEILMCGVVSKYF
jgi:hypothetical protein